jgi:hypothetical protein
LMSLELAPASMPWLFQEAGGAYMGGLQPPSKEADAFTSVIGHNRMSSGVLVRQSHGRRGYPSLSNFLGVSGS